MANNRPISSDPKFAFVPLVNLRIANLPALFGLAFMALAFPGCHVFWAAGYSNITSDGGSSDLIQGELITRARYAQKLADAGRYDEAVAQYRLHIAERLADPRRLEDENPYFYEILIGDIFLKQDKPEEAENSYSLALEKEVAKPFIIDRMRQVGSWYEQHGQLEQGRGVLKQYRKLDTLLFDFDIDRISKKIVEAEQNGLNQ